MDRNMLNVPGYPRWEQAWLDHKTTVNAIIVDYYNNTANVPTALELAGLIRDWFELQPMDVATLGEFLNVRLDLRYLLGKIRQRVYRLYQEGLVSAGFVQHITSTEVSIASEDSYWNEELRPALPSTKPTAAPEPQQAEAGPAQSLTAFLGKETGMQNLKIWETKYPRLDIAWNDSLAEIDREIEDVYRYTEDTAELALDEAKERIEYLLECLPLDITAHFELTGLRHESHILRSKVADRIEYLASQGRLRIPRGVAHYFSPRPR